MMSLRAAFAAALVSCVTVSTLDAQTGVRRVQQAAFPFSITPWASIGFNGVRAVEDDPGQITCINRLGRDCFQYKVGSGPMVGVDLQVPVTSTVALQAGGGVGRPSRVVCTRGAECRSTEDMTSIRGTAAVLFRLKARAPVFFGVGGAVARFDPGPVEVFQSEPTTEIGGVGLIGYDFAMSQKLGARVTWTHYFLKPSDTQLSGNLRAKGLTHDWALTFGARLRIGS